MDKHNKNVDKNIKPIHDVFNENKELINDVEVISKTNIYKILFQYFLVDILEFDLFFYDALIEKIEPVDNYLTFDKFFQLFIFVYSQQIKISSAHELNFNEIPGDNITNISKESMDQIMDMETFNNSVNIVKSLYNLRQKNEKNFSSCFPDFNSTQLVNVLKRDNIRAMFIFNEKLRELFDSAARLIEKEKIALMNLFDLIQIFKANNAICHLDSQKLAGVMQIFLPPFTSELDAPTIITMFEDIDCSKDREVLKKLLMDSSVNLEEVNFTFSNFCLIFGVMAFFYKFPEEEKITDDVKRIDTFFYSNLEMERNRLNRSISIRSEKKEIIEEEEEFSPSGILEEAIRQQNEKQFSQSDTNFLVETLTVLDKELTDTTYIEVIKKTQNPLHNSNINDFPISHVNTSLTYGKNNQPYLFPQKLLRAEVEEVVKNRNLTENWNAIMAAKKKENKKDKAPPKRAVQWEPDPDENRDRLKYLGNKTIEDMKHRFFKLSYKDTIVNTMVYPSLLREIMILPKSLTKEIAEYVLLSYKFQTEGRWDMAISVFEKVKELHASQNIKNDLQGELFIYVNMGNIYESLGLYMQALKYYMDGRTYADRMDSINPDSAIAYANLGSCFYHIREAEWAFRCFWKAKEIREFTLGGDTLDTAAIYNNLGCCLYCLQNYYTAYAFFKLAFEIYHKILGPLHSRTLLIKGNMEKLNQLNFSKPFEYKPMGQVPAYTIIAENPKKKKK